ncbi:RHS repeat-associated core domain-containing protein [Pseudomonas syringae USA007]|uniref:RHS repeat-associated core domain-containing protein n=1 Tax=Pseudomonas syringae USA007 TaxID=1357288 RepID=A0AAU8MB30_PSESX|nr:RHS repeat-associated core domain-containing protein [Pseudomonas syringae]
MAISNRSVLCVYRYDPLDRLADCLAAGQGSARFFYQKNRLATQIQGQIQHTLLRTDEYLLAQRRTENNQSDCALLLTDQQQSVIAAQGLALAYTPYGHRHLSAGPMNLPGFTGQRVDPVTGHYLLGNGYRAFNPVLMRFNSPDSLSPFGEGGLNAYGYCEGDPINRVDPSGHVRWLFWRNSNTRPNPQTLSTRRRVQDSTSAVANTSSRSPSPHRSVDSVLGQDVAPRTSSQLGPISRQPFNDLANTSAGPLPSMPRLPSVAPPTYMSSQSGIHDSHIYDRPPQYTLFESSVPSTGPSGANANNSRIAPVPTRPTSNVVSRVRDAVQDLHDRGLDY